ncbi:Rrf2 family transcriptional regulator [Flammeovirga sp. SR4]|uniref:Rrf2 family transcriptional regulator n=2 Tax=Flammeovirgaceae TaxID=200667 RepID=A0A7X8SHL9_9BACT|nr:Rrf2 family transcriptional regulator [Flammeovirga agarivorans]
MLSKACTYGIRALILVTQKSNIGNKIGGKDVAKLTDMPEQFVLKILQQLSKKELIESVKGPRGGFYMKEEQQEVTLYQVVNAIDGDQLMTSCGLGFEECSDLKPCPLHSKYKSIKTELVKMLHNTTIKEMSDDVLEGNSFLKNIIKD